MTCIRCGGSGTLAIRLGEPDPNRNTHAIYKGAWHEFPPVTCSPCGGTGERTDRPNLVAGWSCHFNADGYVVRKQRLSAQADINQGEMKWINDG